ncbi:glycosyl transferase family protein [Asticcacaulis biprosthecium C19]|uniref:Glycosyl transferase family protein n=1 Tax=Asticcacaulis biprosthecium C19 TaxID=715226 RepID=F4QSK3_9CAUL|nr:glycosyl transferase family protein [Asticcacaulis biprosthecium C19]
MKQYPWLTAVVIGMTVLRLVTASQVELVPDEAYYWLWAQHPDFGYYDHPPMVAWWIVTTTFLSDSELFVRLSFVASFLGLSWLMYDAARVLFDEAIARRTVLWLNACLLLSIGSVVATPDPPSVLMWAGGLWALARLLASNKGWWWLAFGLFAGLGVEAKYTNLFLGLGVAAWMMMDKPARRWLLTPWPYLGGLVALAAMAPNLMWNLNHDWATVEKQFGRIGAQDFTLKFLIEFVLSQPLLLNPLIFVFTALGVLAAFQNSESRLKLLVALPLPLFAYLLVHVFHDRIQGNWTAPVFPGLVLLGAVVAEGIEGKGWNRARWLAAPLGIGLSTAVLLFLTLTPKLPGMGGLSEGWNQLNSAITYNQAPGDPQWVASTDYNSHGELSYHSGQPNVSDSYILYAMAERERYPWQGVPPQGLALIVVAADRPLVVGKCFADVRDAGTASRTQKPGKKSSYRLYTGTLKDPACDLAD